MITKNMIDAGLRVIKDFNSLALDPSIPYEASSSRNMVESIYEAMADQKQKDALIEYRKDTRRKFFVEEAKGFFWVTERSTKHNYAQTDSITRAEQICRDLNSSEGHSNR